MPVPQALVPGVALGAIGTVSAQEGVADALQVVRRDRRYRRTSAEERDGHDAFGGEQPLPLDLDAREAGAPSIEEGSKVTLKMTITLPNDHLIIPPHTSEYTHGAKQLLPGLEQALVGLEDIALHDGEPHLQFFPVG